MVGEETIAEAKRCRFDEFTETIIEAKRCRLGVLENF